jgi:hypothetical protein
MVKVPAVSHGRASAPCRCWHRVWADGAWGGKIRRSGGTRTVIDGESLRTPQGPLTGESALENPPVRMRQPDAARSAQAFTGARIAAAMDGFQAWGLGVTGRT